jgi:tetratricopeptide (TPR) repeat protein
VIKSNAQLRHCLFCEPTGGRLIRFQKFLVLTCSFILLASGPLACLGADIAEEQVATHFRAGQEALRQGEFVRATEEFRKVLALDPTLVEGQVNLGLAYQSLLDYEPAIRYLTKALRARPTLAAPNLIVGLDYLKLGAPAKATPFLKQALKLDGSNREAHRGLASAYLDQGDFRRAAEEFRQTSVLNPDKPEALFKLGHDYLELSARLAYRGAHLYRESAWGHRFLADLLFQRESWESAAREYQKALGIDPRQSGLHTAVGQAYLRGGKLEEAEAEFHREIELDPGNELAWLGIAEKQLVTNQTAAAVEAVGKVWESSAEFLAVQREFPSIELSREAAYALVEKIQTSPDGAPKNFLLAALYSIAGKTAEAETRWRSFQTELTARQEARDSTLSRTAAPCPAHHYSQCLASLEARKALTDAQQLLLGKTQFALRQFDRAADSLAQVTGVTKENVEASYWLALCYHSLGAETYARLEESFPDSWRNHQLQAEGFALRRDLDKAINEFQLALHLKPDEPALHEAIGEAYIDKHLDDDAQRELEAALGLDPTRTHSLCLLGRLYVQKREDDKAVPYLQKALRIQPGQVEASGLLGTAYVRLGKFADAVPKLQQAAPSDFYGNVHYQLALAYRKLGQSQSAQKALTRSQELRRSSLERDQAIVMGVRQNEDDFNEAPR